MTGIARHARTSVLVASMTLAALTLLPGRASASLLASVDAPAVVGHVTIVQPANQDRLLSEGTNTTIYSLRLPDGASCPGDSRNDDWRLQSFMIPADVNPLDLQYGLVSPDGEGRHPLFTTDTTTYTQVLLRPNDQPGQPGVVEPLPAMSFSALGSGDVSTGSYRIGVACTLQRKTARVWDTLIDVTVDPNDSTAFAWSVPRSSLDAGGTSNGTQTNLVVVLIAIGAGIFVVLLFRSRSHNKKERV